MEAAVHAADVVGIALHGVWEALFPAEEVFAEGVAVGAADVATGRVEVMADAALDACGQ